MKTGEHLIFDITVSDKKNITQESAVDRFLYEVTKKIGMTLAIPPISFRFPVGKTVIDNCKNTLDKNHLTNEEKRVIFTTLLERAKIGNLGGYGVSGTAIWVESHCAVHTWEKEKYITIDMFSCTNIDLEIVKKYIMEYFSVEKGQYLKLERFTDKEPIITKGAL